MAEYRVRSIHEDFSFPGESAFWDAIPAAKVDHFLWLTTATSPGSRPGLL